MAKRVIGFTRKVVGPEGGWRRRWVVLFALVMMIGAGLSIVRAVHDTGAFQLDGDASSSTSAIAFPPGFPTGADDWDKVCNEVTGAGLAGCGTTATPTGASAVAWSTDNIIGNGPSPNATIFTGGGSKDPIDINSWAWKDGAGGLPDKDNLLHAFASRYSLPPTDPATNPIAPCPNGAGGPGQPPFDSTKPCVVLYFGSDRLDNSGDAQQGFWFLQNPVSVGVDTNGDGIPDASCPQKVGGATGFCDPATGAPATHRSGDVLVISDFSNGGGTSTITVYKWDPTCTAANKPDASCGDTNLRLLANLTGPPANCATAGPSDVACGLVNPNLITMPWSFTDKSGTPNNGALNGEFFEAGINLSVLNLQGECFSTVGSETRSSTSTTAVLKDFVLATFGSCSSGLITTPRDGSGGAILAGGLSIGTGSVSVRDAANVSVGGASTWTGTLTFFLCGPTAVGSPFAACTSGGTQIGSGIAVNNNTVFPVLSDAATLTSAGGYCWRGVFTSGTAGVPNATDASVGECFTVNPVSTTLRTVAGAGPVQLGTPVTDTANLNGTATSPGSPIINGPLGAPAGGTITFKLFGPNDASCTVLAAGFPAAGITVNVSGDGLYGPVSFTPVAVGTYRWGAVYSGAPPNTLGSTGPCTDASEAVLVTDTTSGSSLQKWLPNDHVTVASTGGSALNGSLDITLRTGSCTGPVVYTQPTISLANTASGTSFDTTNTTFVVNAANNATPYFWRIVFASSDSNISGFTKCETTAITINDNP
jgi:hypothetical protein